MPGEGEWPEGAVLRIGELEGELDAASRENSEKDDQIEQLRQRIKELEGLIHEAKQKFDEIADGAREMLRAL